MNTKIYTFILTSLCLFCLSNSSFAQIPTDGLVGYFMLDGNSADSSGMANNGAIVGQVNPTTNRFGEASKAYLFDGGYIDTGNPLDFQFKDAITFAAWINPTAIDTWSGIFTKWSQEFGGYYLGINPEAHSLRWNIAGPESTDGDSIIIGEWVHIVATFDGDSIKTYQNGILTSATLSDFSIADNTQNVYIGTQSNLLNRSFYGAIDDVIIYNRGLTQAGVDSVFNPPIVSDVKDVISSQSVDLSPNPTRDNIFIKNNNEHKILSYTLCDAAGMKLRTAIFQEELDISDQPSGVYYLILNFENGSVTKKIVKQ